MVRGILGAILGLAAVVVIAIGITQHAALPSGPDPLDLAPANTVAVLTVDFTELANAGLLEKSEQLKGLAEAEHIPVAPQMLDRAALFLVPDPEDPQKEPLLSGALTHRIPVSEITEALGTDSTNGQEVAGLTAYAVSSGMLVALPDPNTVLFGSTAEALALVINTQKSARRAPPAGLKQALADYRKYPVRFAAVLTDEMRAKLRESTTEELQSYVMDINGVAGGIDLEGETLAIHAAATFGEPDSAGRAAEQANSELQQAISRTAEEMADLQDARADDPRLQAVQSGQDVLRSIRVCAKRARLEVTLKMSIAQFERIVSAAVQPEMVPGDVP